MNDQLILSEIHKLPENLKLEVLHFIEFLKKEYGQKNYLKQMEKEFLAYPKGGTNSPPILMRRWMTLKTICSEITH